MKTNLFSIPGPWRGHLAIVPRPRGGDWLDDEASAWRFARALILFSHCSRTTRLLSWGLGDERLAAENQGIDFVSSPIPDRGIPACREAAMAAIGEIAIQLNAGKHVVLHCRQSVGRSGLIAAALLMHSGLALSEALQIVSSARGVSVPETQGQTEWLEQLLSSRAPELDRMAEVQ